MKVVLLQDVKKLGKRGDVIEVSSGYGRNVLIRQGLAVEGTKANLNTAHQRQESKEFKSQVAADEAEIMASQLKKVKLVIKVQTGEDGRVFGSVTARDISEALKQQYKFDFDKIFDGADWFHFTGITPAVSDVAAEVTEAALKAAKAKGVTVSCDLNFRKKLWSSEKAQKVMTNLMQYVDVCIGNEEDAEKVLGFKPGETDVTSGELEMAGYKDIFNQMCDKFGFKFVISSLRESFSASHNGWSACIMDGASREFYRSRRYEINPIVDRVGGGDSFAGGLICGLLDNQDKAPVDQMKAAIEYAVAASALKHTIPGDFNLVTRADVEALAGGDGSGRVQR